jgi:hypothetical protein
MSFIASIFTAIIDIIVSIVEAVIAIVEMIVQLIMILLGWDSGSSQTIEYYEVHNIPLFNDVDKKNPLLQSVIQSILEDKDIATSLIYNLTFRSLKGNVRDFLQFIDNGNYFENFPTVESYILTIDYTELTAALNTLNSVPCTPEGSYLRALSKSDWVKYWLQENKEYNVGTNTLGTDYSTTSTSPASIAADTVNVTPSTNHFDISITSGIATSDEVFADERWQVNLNTIVYNSVPDTYTIQVYNAPTVGSITRTLPYTAPTKPTQLHYVSTYYRDSAPTRKYLFIYQVGSGTYTDLDTIETPIDQDGTTIEALPAVPLRISNANYTTFGATKRAQIEGLLDIIHLDAEEVLNAVLEDPGVASNLGDVDNIYVNFGVRMWDTSQAGMSYLFNMFENLYPSQGVTQGTYNNTAAGDDKPQNNIITTTDDNKLAFQWSYITYTHTSLTTINASSGSTENGIYYSDMSKFSGGILVYPYYVSSGKGTYNVGYKADDLDEVQDFLDGNGVINPGTTTAEAANWLQVTERMSYNNPTPALLESDNSAATLKYLTPDLVYENNGSGVLRLLQQASPETTIGQSITYYCVKPSGLDAYTVVSPIAALKVIDGATGRFNVVKFNLGNKADLMAPFVHNFIKDLSNTKVSQLFLAGCHVSIYIAHYEVIEQAGMSFLEALVMIVVIIVVVVIIVMTAGAAGPVLGPILGAIGSGAFAQAFFLFLAALPQLLMKFAVQMIIKIIITEIAGDNEMLAMILNVVAMAAMASWEGGVTYGQAPPGTVVPGSYSDLSGGTAIGDNLGASIEFAPPAPSSFHFTNMTSFSSLTAMDFASIAFDVVTGLNTIALHKTEDSGRKLLEEKQEFTAFQDKSEKELAGLQLLMPDSSFSSEFLTKVLRTTNKGGVLGGDKYFALWDAQYEVPYTSWAFSETINNKVSVDARFV